MNIQSDVSFYVPLKKLMHDFVEILNSSNKYNTRYFCSIDKRKVMTDYTVYSFYCRVNI